MQVLIEQNYFQHGSKFYKPKYGIEMGSLISGTLTEIYLQLIEESIIKHWIEN